MTDHVHDLAAVREATDRLLSAVGKLDNAAVAEASRLPDWTRGHVLAHLARNADALVNVLTGRPMYASAEARDADIARGAGRPLNVHLADLRDSAARFTEAAEAPGDPSRTVELRNGVTDTAARIPFRRLIEVELHHVDLGIGYELPDLPAEFTARAVGYLTARYSGHRDLPAVVLTAAGGGQWRTGGAEGTPVTVTGTAPALLGWLSGRGAKGADLTADGAPLPSLPPL
ncbi:maleylpyruvate isomerase family mycothiol-dependent enzyme [Streptomyces sp. HU2014]|uniref:maleylpyruvate isomerase family mycothiol-dependent enzyme n=1 Tax=Streptomyces sp. HU2014 TaxID=2939414 RepID=UPI00200D3F02|nr:maleylpyruvate isomerase family mycothiol-dependent enzyme [Streptomyces sp. HU2014]UQI44164.1 maleylpyruvate isomerase family mycothiol-dependent enzyme [Streptomyces sp. HU2014]